MIHQQALEAGTPNSSGIVDERFGPGVLDLAQEIQALGIVYRILVHASQHGAGPGPLHCQMDSVPFDALVETGKDGFLASVACGHAVGGSEPRFLLERFLALV